MENLEYWNKLRAVPDSARKQITGGRLAGFTDINPVWRIKVMTETFGMCGIGWKYEVTRQWMETYGNDVKAFCNINLYVKVDGEWSDAIPGTGGSSYVTTERNGAYVSDECFKMAITDALSVAMKALGVGADIYFAKDIDLATKYSYESQASNGKLPFAEKDSNLEDIIINIGMCSNLNELKQIWNDCYEYQQNSAFKNAMNKRKKELVK